MEPSISSPLDQTASATRVAAPAERLDALLTLPGMVRPLVSPNGKWVAWTWFRAGPSANVFAAPTDGSSSPIRLTESRDDTVLVSWSPDSQAVIAERDEGGDERAQLFRVDLERPGEMLALTESNPRFYVRGGELHPNERWLVYGANYDVAAGKEIEPTWIYRHDLVTGERLPLARPEKATSVPPQLSPLGTHILYTRMDIHPSGQQVWLVDIDGRDDRELFNFGSDVKTVASWFPDGRHLVVLTEAKTHRRLGVCDLKTSRVRWVLDDPTINIEAASVPHGSDQIVVIEMNQGRTSSFLLDPQTRAIKRLPKTISNLILLAPSPIPNDRWIGQHYSSAQPDELISFALNDSGECISLSRVWERTSLTRQELHPAQDFHWKSIDGLGIQGWLYRPREEARGTIVYVHGGPTLHSEDRVNPQIQFFVDQGFNVLDPNYRGSTGFTLEFRELIKAEGWGGKEQDDIRCGIEALLTEGVAEPGKIGITGTSYGGYSSWCAITRFPTRTIAASAPICGMADLVVDYETTRPDLRPYSEEMMGGSPQTVPKRYHDRSPIHFVSEIQGNVLIVQGMQDPNVTPQNVDSVVAALRKARIPYELLTFEDEGHGIYKPRNLKILYQRLVDFFARSFSGSNSIQLKERPFAGALKS
ncbi:MAG TPA: prolyl oligopeptidase family serine peptidase [Chthoniobacterales bacterium]|nr:prolyl oligopeptidase family serine peptidase [Chthoniobacterales bacterium]